MSSAPPPRPPRSSARLVGQEMTVPKPTPSKPPTYDQQDQEKGQDDTTLEESKVESAQRADDDDTPNLAGLKKAQKGKGREQQVRTHHSVRPTPGPKSAVAVALATQATMLPLLLVMDYKPVAPRPVKVINFVPNFHTLFALHSASSSILTPIKAIHKDNPVWNSVYTRLALVFVSIYKLLTARKHTGLLEYEESKVLKALERAWDFESQLIPGPYVQWLSNLGFHLPSDRRFDVICPTLPPLATLVSDMFGVDGNTITFAFPFVPGLIEMCRMIEQGIQDKSIKSANHHGADDPSYDVYWQGARFVPFFTRNINMHEQFTFMGIELQQANSRTRVGSAIKFNSAFNYPFYDPSSYLSDVQYHISHSPIPTIEVNAGQTTVNAPDLLTYFGLKNNTRWIAGMMEALTYEAKFYLGESTLGSLGLETGANILCTSRKDMIATALTTPNWYQRLPVKENGYSVASYSDDVSDFDMQNALFDGIITYYVNGPHGMVGTRNGNNDPLKDTTTVTGGTSPYRREKVKYIRNVDEFDHRMAANLRSEMLLKIKDVLN